MVIYGIFIMAVGKAAMHRSYLYPHNPYLGALSQERAHFFALPRKNRARKARERYAATGRQPVPQQRLRGAHEAHSAAPFPSGDFALCGARERAAARGGRKKGMDTYGFHPSFESPRFPWGNLGATERKRSYLEVGPKKGTAVPLPIHRLGLTPPIPFTAALKPLAVCDSIYAKPVQSAAITPRQRGKREPIPVPLCELPMK